MDKKICQTCRYGREHKHTTSASREIPEGAYICHRFPWRYVKARHDWCGEWRGQDK
jgi:hypothetical protein